MSNLNPTQELPGAARRAQPAMSRLNLILIAALIVQIALVAWVYWPRGSAAQGDPLLPGITADQVTRLRIADAQGSAVELERTADGWALADTDGYPANTEQITTTITSLLGLMTDRLVTNTAGSHDRLQVAEDNFVRQITLATPSGDTVLYLGSAAGAGATHVRLASSDATYLTGDIATWDLATTPSSWINATYFSLPPDEVTSFTLHNAAGTLDFVKDDQGEWTLADAAPEEQVLANNIVSLLTRATGVNLITPLGTAEDAEYGMADPLATLTLRTQSAGGEAAEYTLHLGAKDEETNSYVFKASDSPYYVRIASFTGDEFANKTRADFLAPPDEGSADDSVGGALPLLPNALQGGSAAVTETITSAEAITSSQAVTAVAPLTATEEVSPTETTTATDR